MNNYQWSALYLNHITHYGDIDSFRRASVCVYGDSFQLSRWYKGCGFSPETVWFSSMGEAKKAGEEWVNRGI